VKDRDLKQILDNHRTYERVMERTKEAAESFITALWQIQQKQSWAYVHDDNHRLLYKSWAEYLRVRWEMPKLKATKLIASIQPDMVPISQPKPTKRIEINDEPEPDTPAVEEVTSQDEADQAQPLRLAVPSNTRASDCANTPRDCNQEELLPQVHTAMVDGQRRVKHVATECIRLKAMLAELAPPSKDVPPAGPEAMQAIEWAHYLQPQIQRLIGLCDEIKSQINYGAPYAPCPYCRQGDLMASCSTCNGLRWVSRSIWNHSEKGMR